MGNGIAVKRAEAIDKILADFEGKELTVWFMGSWGRGRPVRQYSNLGIASMVGDRLTVSTVDGKPIIDRHYTKVSCIQYRSHVLFGQFCYVCNYPIPVKWGSCPHCKNPLAGGMYYVQA